MGSDDFQGPFASLRAESNESHFSLGEFCGRGRLSIGKPDLLPFLLTGVTVGSGAAQPCRDAPFR